METKDLATQDSSPGPNYPIIAGSVFLLVSVIVYWFRFPDERDAFVVAYSLTCILALALGTQFGRSDLPGRAWQEGPPRGWLWASCLALVLACTVNISTYYDSVSDLIQFLTEPGQAYERVKFLARSGDVNVGILGGALGPLITMLNFTKYVVFGWTVWYWKHLSPSLRFVSIATICYYALQAVLIGAMVNIGTVLLSTLAILLVQRRSTLRNRGGNILRTAITPAVLGFIALSYFLGSREADSLSFRDRVSTGTDGLMFYISHGYIGLGHALDQPFEFTGGRTIFYGLTRIFGDGLSPQSYPSRSEAATGWSADQLWSTAAPWLASDITFWGVPPLLLALGIWASHAWNVSCTTRNPYALLLLGQLTIAVFFFPANNHLFQSFSNATSFLIILCLYAGSRSRKRSDASMARRRRTVHSR